MADNLQDVFYEGFPNEGYPIWNRESSEEYLRQFPNPRAQLDRWSLIELNRVMEGVSYKYVCPDTPEDRETVYCKTLCFQMVALSEGWSFDPTLYQVVFLPSSHPVLNDLKESEMVRIYKFAPGKREESEKALNEMTGSNQRLSYEDRAGFRIVGEEVKRMDHDESDGLARKVLDILKNV